METIKEIELNVLVSDESLGQIAARDYRKAQVLKKYGIDFCCGGKKTLRQVCIAKGLDIVQIEQDLLQVNDQSLAQNLPYDDWSLDFLADYIVNTHHSYIRKNLPDIRAFAEKVLRVHGKEHSELLNIFKLIEEINMEMTDHMFKEETILFPYIKELVRAYNNSTSTQVPHFDTIAQPIHRMEMEHELVGNKLAEIRALTNNYVFPEGACTTYRLLYQMLESFEENLHLHVHLENNILFPKAIAMEK